MKKKTVTVLLTGVILGVMALTGCSEGSSGQEDIQALLLCVLL